MNGREFLNGADRRTAHTSASYGHKMHITRRPFPPFETREYAASQALNDGGIEEMAVKQEEGGSKSSMKSSLCLYHEHWSIGDEFLFYFMDTQDGLALERDPLKILGESKQI